MKVTYTVKNMSESWYADIAAMGDEERLRYLAKCAHGVFSHCIKQKIGSGQFRDKVELNQILRAPKRWSYSLAPRRGYMLATFEVK